jgi:hypothetical protein
VTGDKLVEINQGTFFKGFDGNKKIFEPWETLLGKDNVNDLTMLKEKNKAQFLSVKKKHTLGINELWNVCRCFAEKNLLRCSPAKLIKLMIIAKNSIGMQVENQKNHLKENEIEQWRTKLDQKITETNGACLIRDTKTTVNHYKTIGTMIATYSMLQDTICLCEFFLEFKKSKVKILAFETALKTAVDVVKGSAVAANTRGQGGTAAASVRNALAFTGFDTSHRYGEHHHNDTRHGHRHNHYDSRNFQSRHGHENDSDEEDMNVHDKDTGSAFCECPNPVPMTSSSLASSSAFCRCPNPVPMNTGNMYDDMGIPRVLGAHNARHRQLRGRGMSHGHAYNTRSKGRMHGGRMMRRHPGHGGRGHSHMRMREGFSEDFEDFAAGPLFQGRDFDEYYE